MQSMNSVQLSDKVKVELDLSDFQPFYVCVCQLMCLHVYECESVRVSVCVFGARASLEVCASGGHSLALSLYYSITQLGEVDQTSRNSCSDCAWKGIAVLWWLTNGPREVCQSHLQDGVPEKHVAPQWH